jgi:hypothetical protein
MLQWKLKALKKEDMEHEWKQRRKEEKAEQMTTNVEMKNKEKYRNDF